jgi:succinoglycan biosynthesis protein ExoL
MARVVFFAFDIAEAAQLRRIDGLRALGHDVASVSFRRDNMHTQADPDWPNLALGRSSNNRYGLRLLRLVRGAWRLWRHRAILEGASVWIARNLDMVLLAVFARGLVPGPVPRLVYECLDIHGLFTRKDAIGAVMRWTERRMLARCDLLILSSPGFLERLFRTGAAVTTPVALLENKLWVSGRPPAPQSARAGDGKTRPSSWDGSDRCAAPEASRSLPEPRGRWGRRSRSVCHGAVHRHAVPGFDAVLRAHPNIRHAGAYRYPDALGGIYTSCDAVWAQDLWQAGANSDWLLPNRIYEASYFGCPSIALEGTETGRRVAADGLGFTVRGADGGGAGGACADPCAGGNRSGLGPSPGAARGGFPNDRSGTRRRAVTRPRRHGRSWRHAGHRDDSTAELSRAAWLGPGRRGVRRPPNS